jgi:hypothetical protein
MRPHNETIARAVTHLKRGKLGGVLSSTTSDHQSVDKDMIDDKEAVY